MNFIKRNLQADYPNICADTLTSAGAIMALFVVYEKGAFFVGICIIAITMLIAAILRAALIDFRNRKVSAKKAHAEHLLKSYKL